MGSAFTHAPSSVWGLDSRRSYLQAHRERAQTLLRAMFENLREEPGWSDLHFRKTDDAVHWALVWFASADAHPSQVGLSDGDVPIDEILFAWSYFWQLLRLAELQKRDASLQASARRVHGRRRKELVHSDLVAQRSNAELSPITDTSVTEYDPGFEHLAAEINLVSADELVARLIRTLEELGSRIHRYLEILWLQGQRQFCRALARLSVMDGFGEHRPAVAAIEHPRLARAAKSKATALALFRYLLLYQHVEPKLGAPEQAAFIEMYLRNVEHPTWPAQPRDRWDIVPKRVVAARLRECGFDVRRNDVARAARNELGRLVNILMEDARRQSGREPEQRAARLMLALELWLAAQSLRPTLRDEYARGAAHQGPGPSSRAIERWQRELHDAIAELLARGQENE